MAEDLAGAAAAWSSKASTSRPLIVLEEREADEKRAQRKSRLRDCPRVVRASRQRNSLKKVGELLE